MITQIHVVLEHSTRLLYVKTPHLFSNEKLLEVGVLGHRFLCSNQMQTGKGFTRYAQFFTIHNYADARS